MTLSRYTVIALTEDLPEIVVAANRTDARGDADIDRSGHSSRG